MSSRLWLALVFVVAFGPQPARAEGSSKVVEIKVDEARVAKVPEGASTLVVGKLGSESARAEASPEVLVVTIDQAKLTKLPHGTSTLILGNPTYADVKILKEKDMMVFTGKGYGETNLIAIDKEGEILEEKQIRVVPNSSVLVFQNGPSRTSYSCNPACMPTVALGDDNDVFAKTGAQITLRNGQAEGTNSASIK
jgi:Pilus formation protein N terminal region